MKWIRHWLWIKWLKVTDHRPKMQVIKLLGVCAWVLMIFIAARETLLASAVFCLLMAGYCVIQNWRAKQRRFRKV